MNTMPFDTHAEIERLRESGLNEKQAKAITQTVRSGVTGGVATKADLIEIKAELKSDIAELKTDMKWIKVFILLVIGGLASVSQKTPSNCDFALVFRPACRSANGSILM